jgi:quercetin dioxygenase-like cupin family protein
MNRAHVVVIALVLGFASSARAADPTNPAAAVFKEHLAIAPDELRWQDCSPSIPPGAKCITVEGDPAAPNVLFTFRIKMPDGFRVPPHSHPADEHVTILSGTLEMGMGKTVDASRAKALPAGGYMVTPKGKPHFVSARGETVIQVHAIGPWGITYVNPADDPRKR